ncbi:MAG: RDD family protein [Actinobacteria bacterium]|nr:RDD family protein [Actinomycetota bacterium]
MSQSQESDGKGFIGRAATAASDRVLELVDPNLVLDHIDVNALLNKVDVNDLLDRVDIDRLLERVDVDALMARADIDALLDRIDITKIVERAGIPEIVAESTSHLGGSALDLFRRPLVGLDEILFRTLNRLVRRDPSEFPTGPGDLVDWVDQQEGETEAIKTGRYAGPLTRLLAVILDTLIVTATFALIIGGVEFLIELFDPGFTLPVNPGLWYGVTLATWAFTYLWFNLAIFGKTLGKAILGVRVVGSDGTLVLQGRQALVRAITYPLSFVIFGLGLVGVVFGRERRAWHDHFAGSAVVYDWGSRTAAMPTPLARFLERRAEEEE